ncbi:MAG: site-specific integrase [Acidaminococcaceae bacterium]|nr:site-specific integrase [Acidaminococcaceae bacterium]
MMARRAKGEGSYIHRISIKCDECKQRDNCIKRNDFTVTCNKRDRKDYWEYQYSVKGADGKRVRKSIYAPSKKELAKKVEALKTQRDVTLKADATLGDWSETWESKYLPATVKENTLDFYKYMLGYIPEKLKKKKLSKVTPVMLQTFLNSLLENGRKNGGPLSARTVRSIRSALITCLDCAIDNGFIMVNPARKTKPPMLEKKEIVYLNQVQMQELIKVADIGDYYFENHPNSKVDLGSQYLIKQFSILIRLAFASGARCGELLGLDWGDIDYIRDSINIHNNLQNGKLVEPKTKYSRRRVSVDKDTMDRLAEWQKYQEQYANQLGDKFSNKLGTIFTNISGNYLHYDNFRTRYFYPMCDKARLPEGFTFHGTRHTHATMLLMAGVNIKIVSQRLGHSSVSFTLDTYGHVLDEMERSAADMMGSLLYGNKKE